MLGDSQAAAGTDSRGGSKTTVRGYKLVSSRFSGICMDLNKPTLGSWSLLKTAENFPCYTSQCHQCKLNCCINHFLHVKGYIISFQMLFLPDLDHVTAVNILHGFL